MPGIDSYSLDNYGLDGPESGPQYATGVSTTSSYTITVTSTDDGKFATPYIIVSGLRFKPNRIVIEVVTVQNQISVTTFPSASGLTSGGLQVYSIGGLNYANYRVDGLDSYVINGGFRLGANLSNTQYRWHAYG